LRPLLFNVAGHDVVRLSTQDAALLQRLLERCADYYEMAEGRAPGPAAAIDEMTQAPPERPPDDVFSLGILGEPNELIGVIGALRNHRRERQWYLALLLLDPAMRGKGLGTAAYRTFEAWIRNEGADSLLLAVLEVNVSAARFWQKLGFGWPRCYPEREIGLRRHILIEFEKVLG
jgi:GNAT superfamily N-acetyltransferase